LKDVNCWLASYLQAITVAASFRISSQGKSWTFMKQAMGDLSNWYYGMMGLPCVMSTRNSSTRFILMEIAEVLLLDPPAIRVVAKVMFRSWYGMTGLT